MRTNADALKNRKLVDECHAESEAMVREECPSVGLSSDSVDGYNEVCAANYLKKDKREKQAGQYPALLEEIKEQRVEMSRGVCWPDQNPEVKPRLPVDIIMRENSYTAPSDAAVASSLAAYDETVRAYYKTRTSNQKSQSWSEQMSGLLGRESRPHMQSFLQARGFMRK